MGVSENSVPLNPMVLLIIIPIKWLFHWEYTLFSDKPIYPTLFIHHSPAFELGLPATAAGSQRSLATPGRCGDHRHPPCWVVVVVGYAIYKYTETKL